MKNNSLIFFHPINDYTGSTRVLSIVLEDYLQDCTCIKVVTVNSEKGFLSGIEGVQLVNVPSFFRKGTKSYLIINDLFFFLISFYYAFRYKVFYINTVTLYPVMIVGRFFNRKLICHIHESFTVRNLRSIVYDWCIEHIRAHKIFVSDYVKNAYKISSQSSFEIKYNKLSLTFLNEVNRRRIEMRTLDKILLLSSLSIGKGVLNYVKLASELPEKSFLLVLSASENEIKLFFSSIDIPGNLFMYPAQNQVNPFFESVDLVLNMSVPELCIETFGMTILEAMAYGIPAIVPNVGGPTELITNGYNGFTVDVTNLPLMKEKILYILNSANYPSFAMNALCQYDSKFS